MTQGAGPVTLSSPIPPAFECLTRFFNIVAADPDHIRVGHAEAALLAIARYGRSAGLNPMTAAATASTDKAFAPAMITL